MKLQYKMPDGTTVILQMLNGGTPATGWVIGGTPLLQKRKARPHAKAEKIRAEFKSEIQKFVGTPITRDIATIFRNAMITATEKRNFPKN